MGISLKLCVLLVSLTLALYPEDAWGRGKVINLHEDNWEQMLTEEWMVEL